MPDPDRPWDSFPPDLWQRLLSAVYLDTDFDPEETGTEAGLEPDEIVALKAWCRHFDHGARLLSVVSELPGCSGTSIMR